MYNWKSLLPPTVRVWWKGPVVRTADGVKTVEGEWEDVPPTTPVTGCVRADGTRGGYGPRLTVDESRGAHGTWVWRDKAGGINGGHYHYAYIESYEEQLGRLLFEALSRAERKG